MNIECIQCMGGDATVANAARVSYDRTADMFSPEANEKLIAYLAKHNHWSPFAHPQIQMRISVPIFLARQAFKHIVGSSKNEVSRRYVKQEPEFWLPEEWRKAPGKGQSKQGSGKALRKQKDITKEVKHIYKMCYVYYEELLDKGMAPEQARAVLPQAMYTEYVDTGSLYYWARVYNLRSQPDAQRDWKPIIDSLNKIMLELFPVSWPVLTTKTTLTYYDIDEKSGSVKISSVTGQRVQHD